MDYYKELEYLLTLERKGRAGFRTQIEALEANIKKLLEFETLPYEELPLTVQDFITKRAREFNPTPQTDSNTIQGVEQGVQENNEQTEDNGLSNGTDT